MTSPRRPTRPVTSRSPARSASGARRRPSWAAVATLALALGAALGLGGPARAQAYLGQAEMTAIVQANALCYDADAIGDCAWVETYHRADGGPSLALRIGVMTAPGEMLVAEQSATWIGDALCLRQGDFGITATFGTLSRLFRFDYADHVALAPEVTSEMIRVLAADLSDKTCFRYASDPADPAILVQHTFFYDRREPGAETVRLIPLAQGAAGLRAP